MITGSSLGQCSSGGMDAQIDNNMRTLLKPESSFLSMQGVPHGHLKLYLVGLITVEVSLHFYFIYLTIPYSVSATGQV